MSAGGQRGLYFLADDERSCIAQHRRRAKRVVALWKPGRFQLLREQLLLGIRVVDGEPVNRVTFLQNIHDAPRTQSRQSKLRQRQEGAGLIHALRKQAARLSEECRSATRCFSILGETALAQGAE